MSLTPLQQKYLGEMFAAEIDHAIEGKIPLVQRIPKRIVDQLLKQELIYPAEVILPGRMPVRIRGYALTPFGHMTYCMSCADEEDNATPHSPSQLSAPAPCPEE
jgi:hypothetical protein